MVMALGTTPTRVFTELPAGYMDHTAARASALVTTRAPARMRAARLHMGHTERAARRRLITRALELTRKHARARTSTAVGDRLRCNAATTGPAPNDLPTAPATRRVSRVEIREE